MVPDSVLAARQLLQRLGAPPRLLRHVELVGEAGEQLLLRLQSLQVPLNADFVRVGIVLHDAGKIVRPKELDASGAEHEPAGVELLLQNGVSPELARVCLTHARFATMTVSLEELLVALADKLWKGVRHTELEQRVVDAIAAKLAQAKWALFVQLDTWFEEIAAEGVERLERSRT